MRNLRDDLETACFNVWTDEGIEVGTESWKESIEQAIRDAQVMVVLLSPSANDSKWVQREIDFAELHGKPILPLLVRGTERNSIPFALSGSQYIDIRKKYDKGIAQLIERIAKKMNFDDVTVPSRPTKRRILRRTTLFLSVAIFVITAFAIGNYRTDIQAYLTRLGGTTSAMEKHEVNVILHYNNQSLVLQNPNQRSVNISDMDFVLYESNDDAPRFSFSSNEWTRFSLASGRCTQVWASTIGFLPDTREPADICKRRVSYFSTFRTFWVSDAPDALFSVWREGELLGRCPTLTSDSDDIVTCELDIAVMTLANP